MTFPKNRTVQTHILSRAGVITNEAGTISGPLECEIAQSAPGQISVHVRYEGALDAYEVEGSPIDSKTDLAVAVPIICGHLSAAPKTDQHGNPVRLSLAGIRLE